MTKDNRVPQTPEDKAREIANQVDEGSVQGIPRMTIEEVLAQDVIKLDLGGGDHPAEGYLNVDIQYFDEVDLMLDITQLPKSFPPRSVDAIMCRDTLQCFSHVHARRILKSWHKILKPRSRIVIQVYDVAQIVEAYQAEEIDFERFKLLLYGRQKNEHTRFQNCFTEESLVNLLERSGYEVLEVVHPEMRIKVVARRV